MCGKLIWYYIYMENFNKQTPTKEEILAEIARLEEVQRVAPQQDVIDTKTRIRELKEDLAKLETPKA